MKSILDRLKLIFISAVLLGLAPSVAEAVVLSVSLASQNNRNIAAGSIENPILGLSVSVTGSDTFNQITVTNLGSAVTNTDITNVQVWYQTANGQFSPATAMLVGILNPTSPNSWQNPSNFNFAVNQNGKIFVTVDLLPGAQNGRTVQANLAANACVFTSGNFPATGLTNTGVQTIQTGGATNLSKNNISASAVAPGASTIPVLHMKVLASGPDPLYYVTVNNLGTAVDGTDIATVKMWDQPAVSGGGFDPTQATYLGNLNMVTSTQWKNATQFKWSIDNNNGLWVTVDLKPTATGGRTLQFQTPASGFQFGSTSLPSGPATNTGVQTIQAGTVQAVNMLPAPADVMLPGSVNNLVYQAVVTATGADILNTVLVNNTGTAFSGGDITAVNLWYQAGGGPFSPGSAVLIGSLDVQSSFSWKNNTAFSTSVANGDGLYVTVDLSASATPNDTCVFQAPAAAFQFNSGSFAASAMTNPNSQTIVPPGQVTGLSLVTVPSGNIWQNSVGNMVLQVSVSANNADILQTLTVNNSAGNADEPTDLGNLTLWYQKGGGAFVPANSINLGTMNRTGTRQWQFTGINKVLSGDGLYITTDVPASATVGNSCDMALAALSVNFQYGGTFPAASLSNPGVQTIVSPPTTSVVLSNLPNAAFFQGTINNPVLNLIVTGSTDTLTGFKSSQLGTATNAEVTAAKFWWQAGGGSFNAGTAVQLDILTLAGGVWKASGSFTNHTVSNNDALFVTVDISAAATIGHTFQMAVSAGGVSFLSSGAAPAALVTNSGIQTISAPFTPTATRTPTSTPTASMTATPSRTATATGTNSATATATSSATPTPSSTASMTATSTVTSSATSTASSTPTSSMTASATASSTQTPTSTVSWTPTLTASRTATATATNSATSTPTPSSTASPTPSATSTATSTITSTPTQTATATTTSTPTSTPSASPTASSTQTPTSTPSWTASPTLTHTPTSTPTLTASRTTTATATNSATSTPTPSSTASMTATSTGTSTPTDSMTASATASSTQTPTSTASLTPTLTASRTATSTPTNSATSTPSSTASMTATSTNSSTATPTNSATSSATSTATPSSTPTGTPTSTMTGTSTSTSINTPTSTSTLTPTNSATSTATLTATSSATATSSPTVTATSTATRTLTSTPTTTPTPTDTGTATPSSTATNTATPTLTLTPTSSATSTATGTPSATASASPTASSTTTATNSPTVTVTYTPTNSPTASMTPTASLTATPTASPTNTRTATFTPTITDTPTVTDTPTITLTFTPVGSLTSTPTPDRPLYLDQNYFDPTKAPLGMDVRVDVPGEVKVCVFNFGGEEVIKLVDRQLAAGNYRFSWDGSNRGSAMVASGVYFITVIQPSGHRTLKVIILK